MVGLGVVFTCLGAFSASEMILLSTLAVKAGRYSVSYSTVDTTNGKRKTFLEDLLLKH
jgi:hypothetical protein